MTLTELRYIVTLARERHFGRAAERCHVSQPTLSVALKKVEQRIGALLFERSSADVRLTPLGEQLAMQAERVLEEAAKLDEIAAQGRDPLVGPLRLGVIYTIAPYLLPQLIPALHARAPQMPLYLQENFTVRLAEQLRRGELDVAVLALPFSEPGILTRPLYDEPFMVALPASHAFCAQKAIRSDQLTAEHLLLLGQGNCFRDQVVQACPNLSEPGGLEGALEGSSLETIRHMVATGAGVTVLPSTAAAPIPGGNPLLTVRPFEAPEPFRRIALAWRVTYPRSGAIDVIRQAILASPLDGVRPINPR